MHALKLSHIIIFQGCRSFSVCAREKVSNVFYKIKTDIFLEILFYLNNETLKVLMLTYVIACIIFI